MDSEPRIPSILRRLSTDEYQPPPYDDDQLAAVREVVAAGEPTARRLARPLGDYWSSRLGTATGLIELNKQFNAPFYEIPDEARFEESAADEAFASPNLVIDVQSHYMAPRAPLRIEAARQIAARRDRGPDWWKGLDDLTFYGFSEYLRCLFLESETAVAILTAPPPDENGVHYLTNDELAGTRELIDRLAGTGRLLNHTVIHPNVPGELDAMERYRDALKPVGWKVYTMGLMASVGVERTSQWSEGTEWMLDDEQFGIPFLERARELNVRNICSHKGLSGEVDNGSPRDIGPCAKAFPALNFIVYHSGFEGNAADEGPYTDETAHEGINRLITTARDNGIEPGRNIYAELGTTWFCLIKRPIEAAHVLGKLLLAFGEDNVIWGTDSVWYGPTQPMIDAFKAFTIPQFLREQYGYPELTSKIKAKILGLNASKVYGIDPIEAQHRAARDDLAWTAQALREYRQSGR